MQPPPNSYFIQVWGEDISDTDKHFVWSKAHCCPLVLWKVRTAMRAYVCTQESVKLNLHIHHRKLMEMESTSPPAESLSGEFKGSVSASLSGVTVTSLHLSTVKRFSGTETWISKVFCAHFSGKGGAIKCSGLPDMLWVHFGTRQSGPFLSEAQQLGQLYKTCSAEGELTLKMKSLMQSLDQGETPPGH